MNERSAERIVEGIKRLNTDVEIEIKDGGQPLYPLQIVGE
jgi:hypothetical protein